MLIECSGIQKAYQGIPVLKDVSFRVNDHDKVAIVGVNGAGKTTILRILQEEESYDQGDIFKGKNVTLGYLSQHHQFDEQKTIYDIALDVFAPLIAMEDKLRDLEQQMTHNHSEEILQLYDTLTQQFREQDGFSYPSKITGVLKGLGFEEQEQQQTIGSLSGGQKTRVALAKILLEEPDILLLDEPTNHLDAQAIVFLEGYLKKYPHAIIVVSHDRYFIDQVTTKIVEIEHGKAKTYACKYQEYSIRKQHQRSVDLKHYVNQQKEIKRMQDSIDLLKSYNKEKTVKRAESKEKQLAKMDIIDRPERLPESISIQFSPKQNSGFEILRAKDISAGYSSTAVFKHLNIDIKKNERIALVGANGTGKTTLFKTILGALPLLHGKITFGSKVDLAYYDQEQDSLTITNTIFQEIGNTFPKLNNTQIRNTLAMFNFKGEDVFKEIALLSGGEKARVVLTKLLLQQANFLLLDEPTNHLDIASKEVLEDALLQFNGTILFISHDRYFINKLATRVIELTPTKAISYTGNYDNYIQQLSNQKTVKKETVQHTDSKISQAKMRKQRNELRKVECQISKLEEKITIIQNKLGQEDIINDYEQYNQLTDDNQLLEQQLEELLELWEILQADTIEG